SFDLSVQDIALPYHGCIPPFPDLRSFFFTATATTQVYTLSLHDALPICRDWRLGGNVEFGPEHRSKSIPRGPGKRGCALVAIPRDRKSTRLNSSHLVISYAVFCLKKKKKVAERDPAAARTGNPHYF